MNEIVKRPDYASRYEVDPYLQFASEGGPGIQGQLLVNKKGDWFLGPDSTPVPATALFLFIVPELQRGWMRWEGGRVTAADMAFVRDGGAMKHRYALGDLDEEQWETLPDGTPRDPWARSYRGLLIEVSPPHGDVTLSGGNQGMRIALGDLCRDYSLGTAQHPNSYPIVRLGTRTRPNKYYGPIKGPGFEVVGWATVEDVKAGRKAQAAIMLGNRNAPRKKLPSPSLPRGLLG